MALTFPPPPFPACKHTVGTLPLDAEPVCAHQQKYGGMELDSDCKTSSKILVSTTSKIGHRKAQEDRFSVLREVGGHSGVHFAGIFDGTVGDHVSELVSRCIADNILLSKHFKKCMDIAADKSFLSTASCDAMVMAFHEGYRLTDAAALKYCEGKGLDYSACTAVTAILTENVLHVAHIGDSRAVLGSEVAGGLLGRSLTLDHKPDLPLELARIQKAGGELIYLHGSRPFLRGGDFCERHDAGERPIQLNYSRAFGGRNLKPFGLSAVPDIAQIRLDSADKVLILGSDGLWDVFTPHGAVHFAVDAIKRGLDASEVLANAALERHAARGSADNVSVVVFNLGV